LNRKLCQLVLFVLFISGCGQPPTPVVPTVDIQQAIAQTQKAIAQTQTAAMEKAWAPYTLTAAAMPTLTSTQTLIPIPSETLASTIQPAVTDTLIPIPTETLVVIVPNTNTAPAQAVCSCEDDAYNCDDFSLHSMAQACFSKCNAAGAGDIHNLDGDGNGLACESLP
jgi:hypothetical protein